MEQARALGIEEERLEAVKRKLAEVEDDSGPLSGLFCAGARKPPKPRTPSGAVADEGTKGSLSRS